MGAGLLDLNDRKEVIRVLTSYDEIFKESKLIIDELFEYVADERRGAADVIKEEMREKYKKYFGAFYD